ncbi:MAG: glycosyltransferase [Caldilineales bacterium]|nr:glycosyltransferase [Caldilineales bacterium]MDW8316340.1 glycosyltransferase [Anaerolineae bacterium]
MPSLHSWNRAFYVTFLALPLGLRAERAYRAMPALAPGPVAGPLPSLSIVVPARNEERNLSRLLPTLQATAYPGPWEIIVVDDGSTDRTAQVAAQHGARVLRVDHLPPGWKGKPHACHQGALAAQGEWLLFTDADTLHAADGPARAVAHALRHGLDGLSLLLPQECHGVGDRLALMAAYAGLFAGVDPQDMLLNGQYILLRRSVYEDSGGFATVSEEVLEDVALGQWLRRLGYRVPMVRDGNAARVHMYRNGRDLWHGMNRLGAESLRWSGPRSLFSVLFITGLMSPLVVLAGVLTGNLPWRRLPTAWSAAALSAVPWAARFGDRRWALLAPLGALFVQVAAVWGLLNRLLGRGVRWKGRRV